MLRWSPFVVVLAACGSPAIREHPSAAAAPAVAMHPSRQPDTAALARDIPRLLEVSGVPGLSMAVVQGGRVTWARGFGTVNDSARTPVNAETIFEAASLSKPVVAYLVLRLADRGEFDLDRPLFQMLEYPRIAHDERYKRITARMVLSHATGLPNWGGAKLTLQFDPGTAYGYSGEGFVYLQKVIEHVTGHPLDELARLEVFEPLGMTRSSYVWQDRFAGGAAYAKDWFWRVAPANQYAQANAAASLLTTATDYARFVGAVLTGRAVADAPDSARAHLALGRALEAAGKLEEAIASYRRAQALDAESGDLQRQIQWAEERVAARAQPIAVPRGTLERYAGQYQEHGVALREGRLYHKGGASPESVLTPMAEDLFEVAADPTLRIRFVRDGAGPAVKLVGISSDGTVDEAARSM